MSSSSSTLVRPFPPPAATEAATAPDAKPTDETKPPSSSSQIIIIEGLQKRWQTVMQETAGGDAPISERWWTEIVAEYGVKEERRYHTLSHLHQMFAEMDRHKLARPDLVALAIFFHDLIYNPRSGTNEEDSAARFGAFAQEVTATADATNPFSPPPQFLSATDVDKVNAYILATKSHQASSSTTAQIDDQDERLFLDFDMSILGQPRDVYMEYAGMIRQEYIHVPREVYLIKRAEVLETFLTQRWIYATEEYRQTHEQIARDNIHAEIQDLRQGQIPCEMHIESK